ncbi:hypothetical protein QQG74_13470 [Micromonospora sp. FIMYZ51]|uniref:hypothetical protein n=1 Tax=Micromonospora sp. FIMYZ51 TaxID=3051832 RepID=UPI00311E3948
MADRDHTVPAESAGTPGSANRASLFRPLVWLLLIISAVTNATLSLVGANVFVGAGFGVATLACATVLVVHHYRHRGDGVPGGRGAAA